MAFRSILVFHLVLREGGTENVLEYVVSHTGCVKYDNIAVTAVKGANAPVPARACR